MSRSLPRWIEADPCDHRAVTMLTRHQPHASAVDRLLYDASVWRQILYLGRLHGRSAVLVWTAPADEVRAGSCIVQCAAFRNETSFSSSALIREAASRLISTLAWADVRVEDLAVLVNASPRNDYVQPMPMGLFMAAGFQHAPHAVRSRLESGIAAGHRVHRPLDRACWRGGYWMSYVGPGFGVAGPIYLRRGYTRASDN